MSESDWTESHVPQSAQWEQQAMHHDGSCACAGEDRCEWCLRSEREQSSNRRLLERLDQFQRHQQLEGDEYGAEVLHKAAQRIAELEVQLADVGKTLGAWLEQRELLEARIKGLEAELRYARVQNGNSAEEWERMRARVVELEDTVETLLMSLVACSVGANANTRDSARTQRITKESPYWHPAVGDVYDTVDREIALRDERDALATALETVLAHGYPPGPLAEIAAERKRQVDVEGWDDEHDDEHVKGELADAAAYYAARDNRLELWPFDDEWNKRGDHSRRRQLVIAGALIVAELERIDRAEKAQP